MKKEELKKLLRPTIIEICKQIHINLKPEDKQTLVLEITCTLIASTINFNQDFDNFTENLSVLMTTLLLEGSKNIINTKIEFDNGNVKGTIL